MQATARQLGQNLRMPGFRKGKVPPPVVIQRIGRESVLDETVRGAMGRWYLDAIDAAGIHPVGDPELDVGDLPGEGQPLTFTIEIGVRPTATLGEYKGVEVGKREPSADDEAVDAELEALRERSARLETAEDAAADKGDFVVMDYVGSIDGENFAGGEGRDQLVELGSGRLVPGFEDQLMGAKAGDERTVTVSFPDDYGATELAGKEAEFAVTRQGDQAQGPARARRRLRLRRGRLRQPRRAARGHHGQAARGRRDARGGRVPRGRPRCRRQRLAGRGARDPGRRPRPGAVGAHAALAQPPGHHQGGLPADRRPRGGRRSSRRPSPTPSRRCAARP